MSATQDFVKTLISDKDFMLGVKAWHIEEEKSGKYAPFPLDLDPKLVIGLKSRGMNKLYSHQRQCYDSARSGKNFLVVTPTASGKTLCYNLPVMQSLLENPDARALYLFPTKALSQDQQSELNEITLGAELGIKIATYDGDTPSSLRTSARETGQIIISNPDMLHSGVLPNHPKWIKFLKNLKFIVVDELHTYRGVFGSHVAGVFRRLRRICAFYGSHPQFLCCSATIGNPQSHFHTLLEQELDLVDVNGAPSGKKHFMLYNPPLVDKVQGIRRGTVNESQSLAVKALRAGVKTIVFAKSRVRVELISNYIKENLKSFYTNNHGIRVESYRGGYLPQERRSIEKGLREGSIQGVVSTNALELGIDIGGLDFSIMAGFPGSIASIRQQAGRAGRRASESLAILIASSNPLDQYLVQNGDYFFERTPEQAFLNPDNPYIFMDHIKCAAFELPFSVSDDPWFPQAGPYLEILEEEGTVRKSGGRYHWSHQSYPAETISLRSATADNIIIIDITGGKNSVIGEMDRPSAKELLHPHAVYLHRDRQFMVKDLDLDSRRAMVDEQEVNYYTDAVVKKDLQVLHEDHRRENTGVTLVIGDVLVRTQVTKFKKLKFHTHENIGFGEVSLPQEEMHTRSLTILFDHGQGQMSLEALPSGLQGPILIRLGNLIKAVAPAFILCQSQDIGVSQRLRDPHWNYPAIHIYDQYPGGSGLAEALSENLNPILLACLDLTKNCTCQEGCPSCIGPRDPQEEINQNPKIFLIQFFNSWLSR